MLRTTERITYRNGFLLNGQPAEIESIQDIFEGRKEAALSICQQYKAQKAKLAALNLTTQQYQSACRDIARALGV